ncbi:MAG: primosome assembly protein PriA [Propionibacteriaceae bacterium]|jgi:primosomal protein N' (replication factor Y)|nr:primosome assembly protein PriA [Propionibacteriaceae bacterium]
MIAQVYVDVGVPHLDRVFDYAWPPEWADRVRPGIRVKVRFSGRLLSGLVVGVAATSEAAKLQPLTRIVSDEVVLPASSVALIRAVADHCAGTFMDVARLALPPRYARAETAGPRVVADPVPPERRASALDQYGGGPGLRAALRGGKSPRAVWTLTPTAAPAGDWADGVAGLVADTLAGGRGALVLAPDRRDCDRAVAAISQVVDPRLVVTLTADQGPGARYTAFLTAVRGGARVVVGTRAAAYTPVLDLGLIVVWDEASSSFAEPRFPYPATRDVVAIRAAQTKAAVVFAAYSRSAEIEDWVGKGWLRPLAPGPRQWAPLIRVAAHDDRGLAQTGADRASRLPHAAFEAIRAGLTRGPVLVSVPWLGYRRNFSCRACGEPMRCACGGGFAERSSGQVACGVCGRSTADWVCGCGARRWRAQTIGSARTAEELRSAFRQVDVLRSDSESRIERLPATPALVIATPGCEPAAVGGYAAAVILDAQACLNRPDLRAGEEAVRRWLRAIALVQPGGDGGTVVIVGQGTDRAVQAVLRVDPVGFAERELADRREAGFPPATRMATFSGDEASVDEVARALGAAGVETLGPLQEIDSADFRLVARVAAARGQEFAALLAGLAAARGQGKKTGQLVWRLDPEWLGG